MPVARPHRVLDEGTFSDWMARNKSHLVKQWEDSEACDYIDLWEWVFRECPGAHREFEAWFRRFKRTHR